MFGMYSSQDEMQETFDVEDEAAAAVWDLDDIEVERLRAAPSQSLGGSQGGLSELLGGDTPAGGVKSTGVLARGVGVGGGGGVAVVSAQLCHYRVLQWGKTGLVGRQPGRPV